MSINKIIGILSEILGMEPEEIKPESTLSSFGIDSCEIVELMAALDKEFGIRITVKDAKRFSTVADIASFIDNK